MPRKNKAALTASSPLLPAWVWPLGLALLAALAFANSLGGALVYDDTRQIAQNLLIQNSAYWGQALTSDVWAFKGNVEQAFSNYWRPTFVAWLILNWQWFGAQPVGWHLTNLGLHLGVTLLAYGWLRALRVEAWLATALGAIFATHPAHVETVSWISGSPDLLMALPLLGALWLTHHAVTNPHGRSWRLALAYLCAVVAVLAKEAAIGLPLLIFGVVGLWDETAGRWRRAALWAAPFAVLAVIYFSVRLQILGQVARTNYGHVGWIEIPLTAPALLVFYVRQSLLPLWLGPNYPLRPVTPDNLGLDNFWGPLVLTGLLIAAGVWVARQGRLQQLGLGLFLIPLLPAFNVLAFIPEHIAHDRYLYLPLLGLLLAVGPTVVALLQRWRPAPPLVFARAGVGVALGLSGLLGAQTWRYTTAWANELALWEWAIQSDPTSAFNWTQYAQQLYDAGRIPEAKTALDRALVSLAVSSAPSALTLRAEIATDEQRFAEAAQDLQLVITNQATNVRAYQLLAVVYQQQNDLNAAATVLQQGRAANPANDCELSTNLAVVYYLGQAKAQAQLELERIRPLTANDFSPVCRQALFYLGELYREQGRTAEAQALYQAYLQLTATFTDKTSQTYRTLAQQRLGSP